MAAQEVTLVNNDLTWLDKLFKKYGGSVTPRTLGITLGHPFWKTPTSWIYGCGSNPWTPGCSPARYDPCQAVGMFTGGWFPASLPLGKHIEIRGRLKGESGARELRLVPWCHGFHRQGWWFFRLFLLNIGTDLRLFYCDVNSTGCWLLQLKWNHSC